VAGFNELTAKRLHDAVRRILGEDIVFSGVSPELVLYMALGAVNADPENRFPQQIRMWSTGPQLVAASVGNVGRLQVANPVGSNLIVVVQGAAVITKTGTGSCRITRDGTGIVAGVAKNLAMDARMPLTGASRFVQSTNAVDNTLPAATGDILEQFGVTAGADGSSRILPTVPIVLPPGGRCDIVDAQVNEVFNSLMWGYERLARPEELIF
jgi:hypothetical protein